MLSNRIMIPEHYGAEKFIRRALIKATSKNSARIALVFLWGDGRIPRFFLYSADSWPT